MQYIKVINILNRHGIKYLVIGGVAVNAHGYSRITGDLDIMISFDKENMRRLSAAAKELGLIPRVPVQIEELSDPNRRDFWVKEKNMKVFSLIDPDDDFTIVDIMILKYIDFEEAYKNHKVIKDKNVTLPVVSIDDLIRLKEMSGRGRDLVDIKALKEIKDAENE